MLGNIKSGSKVAFLLGTQEKLEPYISGTSAAVNGTFYLTSDTHRLYVGNGTVAVPVNEGVTTVSSLADLTASINPHPGEFYYVTNGNILCVYDGKKYVQINDNTNTYVTKFDNTITAANNVATLTPILTKSDNTTVTGSTIQLEAAGGITLAVSGKKVTFTGVKNSKLATTSSDGRTAITLTDSQNNTVSMPVQSANSLMTVSKGTNGELVFTPTDQKNTAVTGAAGDQGFAISVEDYAGTKTGTIDPQITIGVASGQKKTVHFNKGVATLDVYTKTEIDNLKNALNAMTYKGLVATTADTSLGIAAWKDIVNNNGKTSIGDTYLFSENITFTQGNGAQESYSKGTLAIAKTSTNGENASGYLVGTIDWDYVESTTDTDTTYSIVNDASTKKVDFRQTQGGVNTSIGSINFANGASTTATVTTSGKDTTVKFDHNALALTKDTDAAKVTQAAGVGAVSQKTSITVLKKITGDGKGHISNYQEQVIDLLDTNAVINDFLFSSAVKNNVATFTHNVNMTLGDNTVGNAKSANFAMGTSSLTFTKNATTGNVDVDLMWGTF